MDQPPRDRNRRQRTERDGGGHKIPSLFAPMSQKVMVASQSWEDEILRARWRRCFKIEHFAGDVAQWSNPAYQRASSCPQHPKQTHKAVHTGRINHRGSTVPVVSSGLKRCFRHWWARYPVKGRPLDVCDVEELGATAVSPKSKNNGTGNGSQTVRLWLTTAFNNIMIMEFISI